MKIDLPSRETVEHLREQYPVGARVELVSINDSYNKKLVPGERGTVNHVDDTGTIFVKWDCGSGLGIVYNADRIRKVDD